MEYETQNWVWNLYLEHELWKNTFFSIKIHFILGWLLFIVLATGIWEKYKEIYNYLNMVVWITYYHWILGEIMKKNPLTSYHWVVRDSSAVRRLFVRLAGAVGHQSALQKENSGFATPTLGQHISMFRGYRILFSIRNPYINRFTNHFSFHS